VETLHPVETSHAWRVFYFRAMRSYHVVRSFHVNVRRESGFRTFHHTAHQRAAVVAAPQRGSASGRVLAAEAPTAAALIG